MQHGFLRRLGDNLFMFVVLIGGLVVLPVFFLLWLVLGMPEDSPDSNNDDPQREPESVEEEHWS